MSSSGNFLGFTFSAMIAPEIVFTQRLKIFPDRNDGRAGCIKCDSLDLIARHSRLLDRCTSGSSQGPHMVFMRLGRVFGIFALAMQRIFRNRGPEHTALAVDN